MLGSTNILPPVVCVTVERSGRSWQANIWMAFPSWRQNQGNKWSIYATDTSITPNGNRSSLRPVWLSLTPSFLTKIFSKFRPSLLWPWRHRQEEPHCPDANVRTLWKSLHSITAQICILSICSATPFVPDLLGSPPTQTLFPCSSWSGPPERRRARVQGKLQSLMCCSLSALAQYLLMLKAKNRSELIAVFALLSSDSFLLIESWFTSFIPWHFLSLLHCPVQ